MTCRLCGCIAGHMMSCTAERRLQSEEASTIEAFADSLDAVIADIRSGNARLVNLAWRGEHQDIHWDWGLRTGISRGPNVYIEAEVIAESGNRLAIRLVTKRGRK